MLVKDLKRELSLWPDDMPIGVYINDFNIVDPDVKVAHCSVAEDGTPFRGTVNSPNPPFFVEDMLVIIHES